MMIIETFVANQRIEKLYRSKPNLIFAVLKIYGPTIRLKNFLEKVFYIDQNNRPTVFKMVS
jgi:hypothetical protein